MSMPLVRFKWPPPAHLTWEGVLTRLVHPGRPTISACTSLTPVRAFRLPCFQQLRPPTPALSPQHGSLKTQRQWLLGPAFYPVPFKGGMVVSTRPLARGTRAAKAQLNNHQLPLLVFLVGFSCLSFYRMGINEGLHTRLERQRMTNSAAVKTALRGASATLHGPVTKAGLLNERVWHPQYIDDMQRNFTLWITRQQKDGIGSLSPYQWPP